MHKNFRANNTAFISEDLNKYKVIDVENEYNFENNRCMHNNLENKNPAKMYLNDFYLPLRDDFLLVNIDPTLNHGIDWKNKNRKYQDEIVKLITLTVAHNSHTNCMDFQAVDPNLNDLNKLDSQNILKTQYIKPSNCKNGTSHNSDNNSFTSSNSNNFANNPTAQQSPDNNMAPRIHHTRNVANRFHNLRQRVPNNFSNANNAPVIDKTVYKIGSMNPRSLNNKIESFEAHIKANSYDILFVQETFFKIDFWETQKGKKKLSKNQAKKLRNIKSNIMTISNRTKMEFKKRDRKLGKMHGGGGLATLVKKSSFQVMKEETDKDFEIQHHMLKAKNNGMKLAVINLYCTENKNENIGKAYIKAFGERLLKIIRQLKANNKGINIIVAGDFNKLEKEIVTSLNIEGLKRANKEHTHIKSKRCIDLIYSNVSTLLSSSTLPPLVSDDSMSTSDHKIPTATFETIQKVKPPRRYVKHRNYSEEN